MKRRKYLVLLIAGFAFISSNPVMAHDAFKEPMEKKYGLKTVSCKTCHPNNKDRSIHNEFGKLFEEALKGKEITRKFKEAEAKGDQAVAEYEKEMVQEFMQALAVVEKKLMSFEDLIRFGLLNGVRLDTRKQDTSDAPSP